MACILEWVSSTATSIATTYVEQAVSAIVNRFRYMFCLKKFKGELDQAEHDLKVVQQEVDRIVSQEAKSTNVPNEPVQDWIERTKKALEDAHLLQHAINEDKRCFIACCPDWSWRYGRSKQAVGLTATLRQLREERGQFTKLTHEATDLPNIEFIKRNGIVLSKALESALHDIMVALKTNGINMIGLHGMPGVGKTTLAIQVKEEAERQGLFHEFVKVTISEKTDVNAIQERIAEQLQLKFTEEDNSSKRRASKLMLRLKDVKKKFLVLDDVWEELNLNEIGILTGESQNTCKILLTTRRIHVCEVMNCQRKILLDILTDDEACILLKTAANLENNSPLTIIATKVAKECGRLPVAIVSVGKALRGKPQHGWEHALKKLQKGEHQEIRDLSGQENAFRSLKFSFDVLSGEETKKCLLLCSLFPDDHEICVEDLMRYAHGWGLYGCARSIDDTMSDILEAVDELQDSHLLLQAEKKGHVKVHDLVRDIVLVIGRSYSDKMGGGIGFEEWPVDGSFRDYVVISMLDNNIEQLPDRLDSTNLEILLLERKDFIEGTNIPDNCFEGMEKLKVLSITGGILSMRSLENLTNLRTLELRYCNVDSEGLALLGNLKSLEILSFSNSYIKEIPDKIEELKNLKVLELTSYLQDFNFSKIKKLSKLEELFVGLIKRWDDETSSASLMDIHKSLLPNLAILSLKYHEKKIPKDFAFSHLNGYQIHIGAWEQIRFQSRLRHPAVRTLCIVANENIVNACKSLFVNVYKLQLKRNDKSFRNMMPDMSETGFQDLSCLVVYDCYMDCLVSTSKQKYTTKRVFSNLKELEIYETTVKEICEGQPPEEFLENLEATRITQCNQMVTIFPAKLLKGMKKLETVRIGNCQILEDVFQLNGLDEAKIECLSHLKYLELNNLGVLTCICKGPTNRVKLNSLVQISIFGCNSLSHLFSMSVAESLERLKKLILNGCNKLEYIITEKEEGKDTHLEAHSQRLCLQNLKEVEIRYCHQLKYVFPVTMARDLPNLTWLSIEACDKLEYIITEKEEGKDTHLEAHSQRLCLQNLKEVEIRYCHQLKYVFPVTMARDLPNLTWLYIEACDELEYIITEKEEGKDTHLEAHSQRLCLQNLKEVEIGYCHQLKYVFPVTMARDLPNLTRLYIEACDKLEYIITEKEEGEETQLEAHSQQLYLRNLDSVSIKGCHQLKYVFPVTMARDLPNLRWLSIEACDKLEYIITEKEEGEETYSEAHSQQLCLQNLFSVSIEGCHQLKYVFPVTMARDLPNLRWLSIEACDKLEYIITKKKKVEETHSKAHSQQPCLQNLKYVSIKGCHQLKYVFPVTMARDLPKLKWLLIEACDKLENIITEKEEGEETHSKAHSKRLCLQNLEEVKIRYSCQLKYVFPVTMARDLPNLTWLSIEACDKLEYIITEKEEGEETHSEAHSQQLCLQNLISVSIEGCHQLKYVFPVTMARDLPNLRWLSIEACDKLEYIIAKKKEVEETHSEAHSQQPCLQNLKYVSIKGCHQLKYVFPVTMARDLPNLKWLLIEACDKLEYIIIKKEEGEETHSEGHSQQLCLQNLKFVSIKGCHQLKYVFPVTMVLDLPNLRELVIKASDQLSTVFEIECEADSAGGMEEIVFPRLDKLYLEELPRLVVFCPRGYYFKFLCLRNLKVKGCPQMTTSFNAASDASVHAKPDLKVSNLKADCGKVTT